MIDVSASPVGHGRGRDSGGPASLPSIRNRLVLALGALAFGIFLGVSLLLDWSLMAELRNQERAEAGAQLAMVRHFVESRPERFDAGKASLRTFLAVLARRRAAGE